MLNITDVTRINDITTEEFRQNFLRPTQPVIMRSFAKDWPALDLWNFEYLADVCGEIPVPLYAKTFAENNGAYMQAEKTVSFREYLQMLQQSEVQYRMFLFNVYKKMPALCRDFNYPDFSKYFTHKYPFLFFGNEGCAVDVHFDADLSHVFLNQFHGQKTVILFSPEFSNCLYRHPFTVSTNVDIGNPNFDLYPKLKDVQGYRCVLQHGDTLFIPSGWWHYIHYDELSFSLSLRSLSPNLITRARGIINIGKLLWADRALNKMLGQKRWYDAKESWAMRKADKS